MTITVPEISVLFCVRCVGFVTFVVLCAILARWAPKNIRSNDGDDVALGFVEVVLAGAFLAGAIMCFFAC